MAFFGELSNSLSEEDIEIEESNWLSVLSSRVGERNKENNIHNVDLLKERIRQIGCEENSLKAEDLYNRGVLNEKICDFGKSFEDFTSAIAMDDSCGTRALINRGIIYMKGGKLKESIEDFSKFLKANFSTLDTIGTLFVRGNAYHFSGLDILAVKDYDYAVKLLETMENTDFSESQFPRKQILGKVRLVRGRVLLKMNQLKLAEEDFNSALCQLNLSNPNLMGECFCGIAEIYSRRKMFDESEQYFKKAFELNPENIQFYLRRIMMMFDVDEERSLDDHSRMCKLLEGKIVNNIDKPDSMDTVIDRRLITKIYERLKSHQKKYNKWTTFKEDNLHDTEVERRELLHLTKSLEGVLAKKGMKDFVIYRFLGRGVYGSAYLCRIKSIQGVYVLKISKHNFDESSKERFEFMKQDAVSIPYHRNIVPILTKVVMKKVVTKRLPRDDYNEYWKPLGCRRFKTPVLLMKYHRKDLEGYIKQRVDSNSPFFDKEVSLILRGILRGVNHLNSNRLVHRDLHIGNIFVDEAYGRVMIGDFGCLLDFREFPLEMGFCIRRNDDKLVLFSRGGYSGTLAPEILDSAENQEILDYSKSDLFAVGMLGYTLISSFVGDGLCAPFGKFLEDDGEGNMVYEAEEKGREMNKYESLKGCCESLALLIEGLLQVDPSLRMEHDESLHRIEEIILSFENYCTEKKKVDNDVQAKFQHSITRGFDSFRREDLQKIEKASKNPLDFYMDI